jgi:uncharacterized membrane protein YoaK (UPF0700 family)
MLTFVSGLVDATSFVGLGGVFTANMTGNVLFIGFAIAGVEAFDVLGPAVALAAFVVGALAGGRLAQRMMPWGRAWVLMAMATEGAFVVAALVAAAALDVGDAGDARLAPIALLATGMGVRNATVRRLGVADLPTTILTLTITGLASDSRLAGGEAPRQARRAGAIAAMLVGAVVGALCVRVDVVLAFAVTAAVVAAAAASFAIRSRPRPALAT